MTQYNTLLLDQSAWDLVIDSAGNIAMATPPYALAQDVASAVRLFLGELWYNTPKGIPYFEDVLGQLPPATLLTGYMEKAGNIAGLTGDTMIGRYERLRALRKLGPEAFYYWHTACRYLE